MTYETKTIRRYGRSQLIKGFLIGLAVASVVVAVGVMYLHSPLLVCFEDESCKWMTRYYYWFIW